MDLPSHAAQTLPFAAKPCHLSYAAITCCRHEFHHKAIYSYLVSAAPDVDFLDYESGPELLVYLAVVTSGVALARALRPHDGHPESQIGRSKEA